MNSIKQALRNERRVQIPPGGQFVCNQDIILTTLLGSCVAACLYDPVNRVVGMNHFLLSSPRYSKDSSLIVTDGGRYGISAMEILINEMLKKGAMKRYIKAKAFGGASVIKISSTNNFSVVGEVNVRFIKEFLESESIPLVSSDLGGDLGRVIHFFANDFSVFLRKIKKTVSEGLVNKEQKYWEKSIQKRKQEEETDSNIELWD